MTKSDKTTEKKKRQKLSKKVEGKKNRRRQTTLPDIYEKYKFWKSLPSMWKGMKREDLTEKFGIEDEDMLEMLEMRWQNDFAKKFNLDISTLTKWNHRMEEDGIDHLEEVKKWANRLTKNVTLAHYNKLVRKFDPVSADIWYKTVSGFSEKKQIQHSGKLSLLDLAKELDDEEQAIAKKTNTKDQE